MGKRCRVVRIVREVEGVWVGEGWSTSRTVEVEFED
jgi:hypothetical protein